jgi:hypothetical protein
MNVRGKLEESWHIANHLITYESEDRELEDACTKEGAMEGNCWASQDPSWVVELLQKKAYEYNWKSHIDWVLGFFYTFIIHNLQSLQ